MLHIGIWAYTSPRGLCKAFGLRFGGRPFATTSTNKLSSIVSGDVTQVRATSPGARKGEEGEGIQTDNFWSMLFASREVGFGLVLLVLGGLGEWRAVGVFVGLIAGILATTDGAVAGCMEKEVRGRQ